tara:strand:+ start:22 stop:168 length:147 start_codon:yes stop_codon:yes gene_type:complete
MNLVEFLFAFAAVFGSTALHLLWTAFVYRLETNDDDVQQSLNEQTGIT